MNDQVSFAVRHGADVHNYGDILFPRLIRQEIVERIPNSSFEFFSATDAVCDTLQSVRVDTCLDKKYDVALFAGGEVIHRLDPMLASIYERFEHKYIPRPTDLIFELGDSLASFKALIGVGVPAPTTSVLEDLPAALEKLDHISVRGRISRAILQNATENTVSVIPDIGWLIPKLAASERWCSTFIKEKFDLKPFSYISAQAIPGNVYSSGGIEQAVSSLMDVSLSTNMPIVMVPLTDCWDDYSVHEQIRDLSSGRILSVPASLSYQERGMIVAESFLYIGQSLHGFLTATSHGRPGFLVCAHANDQKFRETMDSCLLRSLRITAWSQLPYAINNTNFNKFESFRDTALNACDTLDTYFDLLCELIKVRVGKPG